MKVSEGTHMIFERERAGQLDRGVQWKQALSAQARLDLQKKKRERGEKKERRKKNTFQCETTFFGRNIAASDVY